MDVGRRQKKKEWQTGATADQRMNTIATQEWAGVLCGSVTKSGIRISTAPGEDGNAIDDEIASPNEPATQSGEDRQDKKRFRQRCPGAIAPLPLLRGARDARTAILHR
jgi:hypothetical protein